MKTLSVFLGLLFFQSFAHAQYNFWQGSVNRCTTVRQSCLQHLKAGCNTSGVYQVRNPEVAGGSLKVYCEQKADGGGWMLVMKAYSSLDYNVWYNQTGSYQAANLLNNTITLPGKLSDSLINQAQFKTQGYKLDIQAGSFGNSTRFTKAACVYSHNGATIPAECQKTYSDTAMTLNLRTGYDPDNQHFGISDWSSANVLTIITSANNGSAFYVGNGTTASGYYGGNSAGMSFQVWIR